MNRNLLLCASFVVYVSSVAAQNMLLTTGSNITTKNGAQVTLHDIDLTVNGSIAQASGDGSFVFTGKRNSTISGSSLPLFDHLSISKTGGSVLSLQNDIHVLGGIDLVTGIIDMQQHVITLAPLARLNGESAVSYVTSTGNGYIEITTDLKSPVSANPGQLGAVFTSAKNMGSTIVRRAHATQVGAGSTGGSIHRYYDIIPANNTALDATLRFYYLDAELFTIPKKALTFWKSTDTLRWANQGASARDADADYVERTGIADFSRWTLAVDADLLPLQFGSFIVYCRDAKAVLQWQTFSEQNTDQFYIERSTDGISWTGIGKLKAAGYSVLQREYTFDDVHPLKGALYRIAEIDLDGRRQFSNILHSNCDVSAEWSLWPNPVTDVLTVNITSTEPGRQSVLVYDSKAALVKQQSFVLVAGNNKMMIDMRGLPAGVYSIYCNGQAAEIIKR